jgi:acetate---CoA ligase (ADP-forming)
MTTSAETSRMHLVTPGRLREFFHASSIAMVGASDTSGWARNVFESLRTAGFDGRFVPVHPRHATAFGIPTRPSLCDLDQPVDLAFVLTPTEAVEGVVRDAATAGVRNLVILAAGFGEQGESGRTLERNLVSLATQHNIVLLGPNGLGFINAPARVAPYGLNITPPLIAGSIGVVLQSGALASAVLGFAHGHALGLSLLISMGNEAMITTADVIEYLVEDAATNVIALFLEEIRQPERFAALAGRALEGGKAVVALKVGRSPAGQRTALAHTGAVAGDDAVVDAALRQFGIIRVRSLEELLVTAGLLSTSSPPKGRRMGVVTASGGACDIIADRAHDEGIEIPEFAPETIAALRAVLPGFTVAQNPVDATGYGLAHQASAARPITTALEAVAHDPNIDFVFYLGINIPGTQPPDPAPVEGRLDDQTAIVQSSPIPVLPALTTCSDISDYQRSLLMPRGLSLLAGLDLGMTAIGHALRWEERRRRGPRSPGFRRHVESAPEWLRQQRGGVWPESLARRVLEEAGVPTVPAELVHSAEEAVLAAERLGYPVVLKICGSGIAHKSDIGGVVLNLASESSVLDAYARLARRNSDVLVATMRTRGYELLAGVTVDATFGPVLAVGLGGVWVETLHDAVLRVLPIEHTDARQMLDELRAAPLLHGARGGTPVDLDLVADVLVRITNAAAMVGPSLEALEVNPLWCSQSQVEALDVLIVTRTEEA